MEFVAPAAGEGGRSPPSSLYTLARRSRAPRERNLTRRLPGNRPCSSLFSEEPDPKGRLRVGSRIVQGLYDDAVKEIVEL